MLRSLLIRKQFSLTTLFVVVTVVAMAAAAYGMHRRAVLAEDQALAKIASKGARVFVYRRSVSIEFVPPAGTLRVLRCGTGIERSYPTSGSALEFQDADLTLLDDVRTVNDIDFRNTGVSTAAVEQFRLKYPKCRVEY